MVSTRKLSSDEVNALIEGLNDARKRRLTSQTLPMSAVQVWRDERAAW